MIRKATQAHIGKVFGRLTILAIQQDESRRAIAFWQCSCGRCGTTKISNILRGYRRSCGCLAQDRSTSEVFKTQNIKHGKCNTKVYNIWRGMHNRCRNSKDKCWHRYGGRGITVSDAWKSFEQFYADMGDPPVGCSIDRKDNEGNYCKENCRWATILEQANNTSTNKIYAYNSKRYTIADLARELKINSSTLGKHLREGWDIPKILACYANPDGTLAHYKIFVEHNGVSVPLRQLAKELGLSYSTARDRLRKGYPLYSNKR